MHLTEKLKIPGDHSFLIKGQLGQLEAILSVPENVDQRFVAILGHPHSLQGGTMHNKVVTTLARVFKELHIASLRFNFRGVGQSQAVYDAGIGESEDMLLIARQIQQELPNIRLLFAGFSFGSYVAYRAAAQCKHELLITVAPAVHHYDYQEFNPLPAPWITVHGDKDEVVPVQLVLDFVAHHSPNIQLIPFTDTSHFFHGKLIELKSRLLEAISEQVDLR